MIGEEGTAGAGDMELPVSIWLALPWHLGDHWCVARESLDVAIYMQIMCIIQPLTVNLQKEHFT